MDEPDTQVARPSAWRRFLRWMNGSARRRFTEVTPLSRLAQFRDHARIRVRGRVEAGATLLDPISGERVVAMEYRAWPPATTVGTDGAPVVGMRAFQIAARQAVNFSLVDTTATVRVEVDEGDDAGELHARLIQRYGVGLRTEAQTIPHGAEAWIEGILLRNAAPGSPHRREPERAVIRMQRMWLPEADEGPVPRG